MFRSSSRPEQNSFNERGALLIEFLVALGLMSILLVSGLDILGPSLKIVTQSKEKETVASLIQEQFEVIRSVRNEDWNALAPEWTTVGSDPLECPGGESDIWHYEDIDADGEGLTILECTRDFGKYTVGITFVDVYRDGFGDIISAGDPSQIDNQTKKVTVEVNWETYGIDKSEVQSIYLTNWDAF